MPGLNVVLKHPRRSISGVLLFDKTTGLSSNRALQQVKRLFQAEKTGHTGTLDPLASGLLPLLFGQATKFAADLIEASKTYETVVRLGYSSSTGDAEGEIVPCANAGHLNRLSFEQIQSVCESFVGEILQTPPMYSALKKEGKPLYEYARNGQEVERLPRPIQVHALTLLEWNGDCALEQCSLKLRIACSKGTYIRTLGEDLAKALGTRGYLTALRRTHIGDLSVDKAMTLAELEQLDFCGNPENFLIPVDSLLKDLAPVNLDTTLAQRFLYGQRLPLSEMGLQAGRVKVYCRTQQDSENEKQPLFLGTGILETDGNGALLRPDRLIQVKL